MRFVLSVAAIILVSLIAPASQRSGDHWTRDFALDRDELASTGRNPYFILEPGYRLVLADGLKQLTITVLEETAKVDDVETRVVEEMETAASQIVEVSRNYYVISRRNNSIYYFGEEVDIHKAGRIVSHQGSWQAGTGGARFGLMMPGLPLLRARYYQELAPGVAMDRAEIVSLSESLRTRAGEFSNVLKIAETTPLERGAVEYKYYAKGIGLIQDGTLKLVSYGKARNLD